MSVRVTEAVPEMRAHDETNENMSAWAAYISAHVIVSKAVKENDTAGKENVTTVTLLVNRC
jgi:hypothetical protein